MQRFLLMQKPIAGRGVISGTDAVHINRVLRKKKGDRLAVIDGAGGAGWLVIENVTSNSVEGAIDGWMLKNDNGERRIFLCPAVLKGEKYDWVMQKAVELGSARIYPLLTERCVVRLPSDSWVKKTERWQKIIREAAKQCGCEILPELMRPYSLPELLTIFSEQNISMLMLHQEEREHNMRLTWAMPFADNNQPIALLIGPEGGFSKREVELCREAGARLVSLGKNVLRAETAAMVGLAILKYETG